ncbi:unnamed protein product [Cyclocybe aegerita]|uniref:FYVE-type domain-containing protein n=1 Tax=Cyclocybe aegerita TaxID=1973307 RepID=A0A8S0VSX5_CYCAE|nr:unnamed protein product [Cyclocybe aegerita]
MSAPSSPPASTTQVPYLAYKSKRHSRNLSNPMSHLVPNQSPPPVSRPSSSAGSSATLLLQPPKLLLDPEEVDPNLSGLLDAESRPSASPGSPLAPSTLDHMLSVSPPPPVMKDFKTTSEIEPPPSMVPQEDRGPMSSDQRPVSTGNANTSSLKTTPGTSMPFPNDSQASLPKSTPRKSSTFRRVPLKSTRAPQPSSHLRNVSMPSLPPPPPSGNVAQEEHPASVTLPVSPSPSELNSLPDPFQHQDIAPRSSQITPPIIPRPSSPPTQPLLRSTSTPMPADVDTVPDHALNSVRAPVRKPAPYRPGFQPKGVYRPLTDEFLAIRRIKRDGEGDAGTQRVERTKLERRLEKLIALHFPDCSQREGSKEKAQTSIGMLRNENRRASSLFDFQSLRNISEPGELLRVFGGGFGDATKNDIRAVEQRITPWQDDASVNKCPLCLASFHPLTNRKHHCRLCGQIICSLPIKHPQRKALCSILFVVDKQTRQIEEVGQGVDYGVRKRKTSLAQGQPAKQEEDDKFLKGVRICQKCRPTLLRQQYEQQAHTIPPFVKLHETFISLEADIEEALPKFQELLMSLNHHDQPTKEASAARKRLLEAFAQYDKLSKTIRALPCPNGAGSSQDRLQMAVMTRANLFLQKNMFPLQSLPTPHSNRTVAKPNGTSVDASTLVPDMDAALAHALQPLLEQEALLESFVEEAQAQRKFEDVKSLKINLAEIRLEIEKLLDGSRT